MECFLIRALDFLCSGMSSRLKEMRVKLSTYHSIHQTMMCFSTSGSSSSLICGSLLSTGSCILMETSSIIQWPSLASHPQFVHVNSLAPCIMHVCINKHPQSCWSLAPCLPHMSTVLISSYLNPSVIHPSLLLLLHLNWYFLLPSHSTLHEFCWRISYFTASNVTHPASFVIWVFLFCFKWSV